MSDIGLGPRAAAVVAPQGCLARLPNRGRAAAECGRGQGRALGGFRAGDYAIATIHLTIAPAPPTVTIASPRTHATYQLGQVVRTRFECAEGTGGPGLKSCTDQLGHTSGAKLDTATVGRHTLTVKAVSRDGQTAAASVTYVVVRSG